MRNRTPFLFVILAVLCLILGTVAAQAAETITALVPAATFFPVLPFDAPPDAEPQLLPLASNHPLTEDHAGVTRAVVVIHDFSRDASRSLAEVASLAGSDNGTTLILAPQFLLESDIGRFSSHLPEQGRDFARWPLGGWSLGGDSITISQQQRGISSFTVLDLLLLYLSDRSTFPDIKQIVVAGHGEGADFVQRYAAIGQAPDVIDPQIGVRFVTANPSTYLYFTASRPKAGKGGFGMPDAKLCPDYNNWPYGLDNLNPYARHVGANAAKMHYAGRSVTYIAGSAVAKNDPAPDTSCAAIYQGGDRGVRAANYADYLDMTFGEDMHKTQSFVTVANASYDTVAMFGSRCGTASLFGDGNCAPAPVRGHQ